MELEEADRQLFW